MLNKSTEIQRKLSKQVICAVMLQAAFEEDGWLKLVEYLYKHKNNCTKFCSLKSLDNIRLV